MSGLDATEVGVQAARVYEVQSDGVEDGVDGTYSTVGGRVTDDRSVIGLGLVARMHEALLEPTTDLGG